MAKAWHRNRARGAQGLGFLLLVGLLQLAGASAFGHGLTLCVGAVYDKEDQVSIDLRIGVGILHKYVDPDDDAKITPEEWTSSSQVLEKLFASGIKIRVDEKVSTPSLLKLNLTSGAEVQILATLDAKTTSPAVHLALPILRKFPGAPPAQVSVWREEKMVRAPELLWFDQELPVEQGK